MALDNDRVIESYQEEINKFVKYPKAEALEYLTLGLTNEAGEVAGKVKKRIRDGQIEGPSMDEVVDELGDVLFYLSQLAQEAGTSLENVAITNYSKLDSRLLRGKLGGSGDDR